MALSRRHSEKNGEKKLCNLYGTFFSDDLKGVIPSKGKHTKFSVVWK